ncbi:protein hinderin isoform X1 [Takifugu flavidus]|uniref:Protein hinderin n=2 Tax=Takifugu TaxID=31032 RepID=A0A5C6N3L3_9TELE|nr:protein hinderin isoform X1 [Takifugu flavidus]TWW61715.1 Protein hinderin [Takifugu flavidus]
MAAAATKSGNSVIFWKSSESDEEQPLVFIPGVAGGTKVPLNSGRGSAGTASKRGTRTRRSNGKKETLKRQDYSESESSGVHHPDKMSAAISIAHDAGATKVSSEPNRAKGIVSLKDLCPDDKRRIANLIEELAKVSEEKEVSVQRLKDEHQNFEQKIQQLEEQNVMIAQERESLQHQYRECQELLGLYQQYLSLQQVKLNQSIAHLSQDPAVSKVLSREEAISSTSSHRSSGSPPDGSDHGFAATGPQGPRTRERCGCKEAASGRCVAELSPENRPRRRHTCESRGPQPESDHSCHRCRCRGGCYEAQQKGPGRKSGPHEEFGHHRCEGLHDGHGADSEAQDALMMPVLGHKDWEEKRHQLLLQKMQLEVERERLQVRLAQQEERLNRQNQQLQQSRLHSHRDQQADFSRSYSDGGPCMEASIQQQLPTRNKADELTVPADGESNFLEKHSQPEPALTADEEALRRSRKEMGPSSVKPSLNSSKATPVSLIQDPPQARMEVSVVELLDIMSPITAPKPTPGPPRPSRQPVSKTPRPGDRAVLTPTRSHHWPDQEESQILEDIFFIC